TPTKPLSPPPTQKSTSASATQSSTGPSSSTLQPGSSATDLSGITDNLRADDVDPSSGTDYSQGSRLDAHIRDRKEST
ncbi:MAG TPA: hypothetical protein VJR67_03820, partial [Candidatus Nitrosopolaris sp.]|nr:hypothetical protein [Candidatus Nitrosopolaris sp.]